MSKHWKKIQPVESSHGEYEMWSNIIEKVNELVNAVNELNEIDEETEKIFLKAREK